MTRIPYGNDYTVTFTLKNASGTAVAPTTVACAVTNGNGSAVTLSHSVSTSGTVNYLELASTEVTSSAYLTDWTFTWTGTYGTADFTDVEKATICKPGREWSYGTVPSVQDRILVITFTSTTTPSTSEVDDALWEHSLMLDARLSSDGHTTPLTTQADRDIVDVAVTLLASADILERLIIGREPTVAKVETAETWRRKGEAIVTGILDGTYKLTTAPTSGIAAIVPGVSNATAVFSASAQDSFVDTYGAAFDLS